ncbi:MAG: hypothetical protein PUP46_09985 [Endozoicomonas sp. (ex Botrylloides leachii)]|nr:hypothetical protein [Endozoicomonas sp. (ex Botrylloides leachii)]
MNIKQLKKNHALVEKKKKLLEKEAYELDKKIIELKNNKQLIEKSLSNCDKKTGDKLTPIICWNINDFSSLTSGIIKIITQRIQEQKIRLDDLNKEVKENIVMAGGIERLLIKEEKRQAEHLIYVERLELEDSLARRKG